MGLGRVSRKMRMRFTKYSFAQSPLCLSQREQRLWGFSGPLARHLQGTELRARASISELSAWPASQPAIIKQAKQLWKTPWVYLGLQSMDCASTWGSTLVSGYGRMSHDSPRFLCIV